MSSVKDRVRIGVRVSSRGGFKKWECESERGAPDNKLLTYIDN